MITIAEKFRGPPMSGNGGYVGGVFAQLIDPNAEVGVEVTLRAPIPLDKPLSSAVLTDTSPATARVTDGDVLIAEVRVADFELDIPTPPQWQEVEAVADRAFALIEGVQDFVPGVTGFHPICFCCGAGNPDGLQVFVAPVGDQVAAVWPTKIEWADEQGLLPIEYLWTAMDCPGQFAYIAEGIKTGLLGRMTAKIHARPKAGTSLLVSAWTIRVESKKHFAGAALHTESGELVAQAMTLWIGTQTGNMTGIAPK